MTNNYEDLLGPAYAAKPEPEVKKPTPKAKEEK
jgi:hypothetical protein